jgi:hypothetical protein
MIRVPLSQFGRSQTGRSPHQCHGRTSSLLASQAMIGVGFPLPFAGADYARGNSFALPLAGRLCARCLMFGAPGAAGTRHVNQSAAYSDRAAGRPGLQRVPARALEAGVEQTLAATRALSLRSRRDRVTDPAVMMQPTSARFQAVAA